MNIPFVREPQVKIQSSVGNAAVGGAPNKPFLAEQYPGTFPRVNLNPQFKLGAYNNAHESYNFPRFNKYWEQPNQSTYNPVKPNQVNTTHMGNAGNGDNKHGRGAGYTPSPYSPYDISSLGSRAGYSQTFPYDSNSMTVEGSTKQVWKLGFNVNEGEPIDIASGEAQVVQDLLMEMKDEPIKMEK